MDDPEVQKKEVGATSKEGVGRELELIDWDDEKIHYVNIFIDMINTDTDERTKDDMTSYYKNLRAPRRQVNPRLMINNLQSQTIQLHEILDGVNSVALIGDSGSGKTTTMKRFAQMVLEKQIPSLSDIRLVCYIDLITMAKATSSNFPLTEEAVVHHLLSAAASSFNANVKKYGCKWAETHRDKILFILDKCEQIFCRNTSHSFNSLLHHLFWQCKVVVTHEKTADASAQKSVYLYGLTVEVQEYFVRELSGEDGDGILQHLHSKAPSLLSLCRDPGFLIATVATMKENLENFPQTLSEILIRSLAAAMKNGAVKPVFQKLKIISYRRVCFGDRFDIRKEFSLFQLNLPKNSANLLVAVKQLLHPIIIFDHQSLLDALAALHMCCDIDVSEFRIVIAACILPKNVIKILCGILLNPRMNDPVNKQVIGTVKNEQEKKIFLTAWLKGNVQTTSHHDYDLCMLLRECGDGVNDIIKENLRFINCSSLDLQVEDVSVLTSVISRSSVIDRAWFQEVWLNSENIKPFADCLKKCRLVEISSLNLSLFQTIDSEDYEVLEEIVRKGNVKKSYPENNFDYVVQEITPSGGQIKIRRCVVTFPEGAVDQNTIITLYLRVYPDTRMVPNGFFDVTASMECRPNMAFGVPVKFRVNTWVRAFDSSDPITCKIFSTKKWVDGVSRIKCIDEAPISNDGFIEFSSFTFSGKTCGITEPSRVNIDILHFLCVKRPGAFTSVCCIDDETLLGNLHNDWGNSGYKLLLPRENIATSSRSEITVQLTCPPSTSFAFDPDKAFRFSVDDTFMREKSYLATFNLKEKKNFFSYLRSLFSSRTVEYVYSCGSKSHNLCLEWPIEKEPPQITTYHHHGDIAGKICKGQGTMSSHQTQCTSFVGKPRT